VGIWVNGPSPLEVDIPGIAEAMRPALYEWFSGHVQIIDLNRRAATAFDPVADTGGVAAPQIVLDSGVGGALIQPIRQPTRIDYGAQPNGLLGIRFQLKIESVPSEKLRGGLAVKVVDGGNESDLTLYTFALGEAINSSLAWGRIFEATVITGGQ
jgi:hypothetical protein